MNFFESQSKARKKTFFLVFYFILCVLLIIFGVYLVLMGFLFYLNSESEVPLELGFWYPEIFYWVAGFTLFIVFVGSLYKVISLSGSGKKVAELLQGKQIEPNTRNLSERKLLNVVEEMAIASGVPVPPVYLLDEAGINAFAAGMSPQNAVIGVTRGCMENLNRDELQGVIAHEFSHIFNGDMRMNIRLMGVLHGILVIAFVGQLLMRSRGRRNPLPLLGLALIVVGYAGIFFGRLIKAAISRQREFLADASALQFTRNPGGIGGALKKIGGSSQQSFLGHPMAEQMSHAYFANGVRNFFFQAMSTHPPLVERIKRIDPQFDGIFPKVASQTPVAEKKKGAGLVKTPQGKFHLRVDEALGLIGNPGSKHLLFAAALIGMLPEKIKEGVREPFCARAVIYLLLLDKKEAVCQRQLKILEANADPTVWGEVQKLERDLKQLGSETRLPLIDMAMPALQQLSEKQYQLFRANIKKLMEADQKIDLFEFVLEQILLKHLDPHFKKERKRGKLFSSLDPIQSETAELLSAVAHFGHPSLERAQHAFERGREKLSLKGEKISLLSKETTKIEALAKALEKLTATSMKVRETLLEACAACIIADEEVTVEESELLRAIADAFDAPMPPLGVS